MATATEPVAWRWRYPAWDEDVWYSETQHPRINRTPGWETAYPVPVIEALYAPDALAAARAEGKAEGMLEAAAEARRIGIHGAEDTDNSEVSRKVGRDIETAILAAIPAPAVGAVPEPDPTDGLPPIDSIILGALLHLPVPGETLRMAAMQVRSVLDRSGNLSSAVPEQGERGDLSEDEITQYLAGLATGGGRHVQVMRRALAELRRHRASRLRAPDGGRETVAAADERAVERKAIELATAANMIWEELEDYGSGGENRTTYRKLAVSRLRAPDGEGV